MIDDWITVGSSNLNHRSFLHDLELDVVLTSPDSKLRIAELWHQWNRESRPLSLQELDQRTWWEIIMGRLFYWLRWWL